MNGTASPPLRRAVFLDRDGVLNRAVLRDGKPTPPESVAALEIPPDVPGALAKMRAAGFLLIGVTNQPDVARGQQTRDVVEAINRTLLARLPLDDIFVCYHDDADDCPCRKPAPGLLLEAAAKHGIDPAASFLIGDRWKDVDAGHNAGCRAVLLRLGYAEREPSRPADWECLSVAAAAEWILAQHS